MRFHLVARRIMAPALGLALAVTVAACSSSSSSSAATSPSSSTASSPASSAASTPAATPGATLSSAAVAQITANWEKFFSSSTTAAQKATLLQNGSTFASAKIGRAHV